jgi:hypothetical protein
MNRHPLDPVSLVLGLVALAAGISAIAGRLADLLNEQGVVIPMALGLVGVMLILSARQRPDPGNEGLDE